MRCRSDFHPQVPVTHVTLAMTYCHECMGWRVYLTSHCQLDDEDPQVLASGIVGYGPFDDLPTIAQDTWERLWRELNTPGRPWDLQPLPPAS